MPSWGFSFPSDILSINFPTSDIGKVGTPDSILLKQEKLTPQEFEIMKTHTIIGEKIPIEGRIMYLIDKYDALRSRRPYKPPFRHEDAVRVITEGNSITSPDHFDPDVLEVFMSCSDAFRDIFDAHRNDV